MPPSSTGRDGPGSATATGRHLTTFLDTVAARTDGAGVPGFVPTEFRKVLGCGVRARGFALVP